VSDCPQQDGHLAICQNCHTGWRLDVLDLVAHPDHSVGRDEPTPAGGCPDCRGTCTVDTSNEPAGVVECAAGCGRYLEAEEMESTYCGSACQRCLPAHLAQREICRSDVQ
jgi:hypothetical protein